MIWQGSLSKQKDPDGERIGIKFPPNSYLYPNRISRPRVGGEGPPPGPGVAGELFSVGIGGEGQTPEEENQDLLGALEEEDTPFHAFLTPGNETIDEQLYREGIALLQGQTIETNAPTEPKKNKWPMMIILLLAGLVLWKVIT